MTETSQAKFLYPEALVSAAWLSENLDVPNQLIFDCTTYLRATTAPNQPYRVESGRGDYDISHIPNSAYLDLQADLSDSNSKFRFTILPPEALADRFRNHGISDDSRVILYARENMQWATRVWWMLRYIGFDNAAILDGGWSAWCHGTYPTTSEPTVFPPAHTLTPKPRPDVFVDKVATQAAIEAPASCIINALGADLHSGANDRYGRPGRIPGSVNVPAQSLQVGETKCFPPAHEVATAFANVGAEKSQEVILYCGGGIAATLDAYLLHQLGYKNLAVYDNSMSEWANDAALPIETDS